MIESKVPKDIERYETKTIGPFTTRQAIAFVLMGVLDFIIIKLFLLDSGMDVTSWVYILVPLDLPIAVFGFIKIHGVPVEKYLSDYFTYSIVAPSKRKEKVVIYNSISQTTNSKKKKKKKDKKKTNYNNPNFKPYL